MNPITVAIGVLLATSVAGNAFLFSAYGEARDRAARADTGRKTAVNAAQTCSNYVGKLTEDAARRKADAALQIDAAAAGAADANSKADAELIRAPAVPNDVCASAETENREWLERRRRTP